jgi:hypothetical protein
MSSYSTTYGPNLTAYSNVTITGTDALKAITSLSTYIAQGSVPSISGSTVTISNLPVTNSTLQISVPDAPMADFKSSNLILHQNIFDGDAYILANLPGNTATGAVGSTGASLDLMNGNTGSFNVVDGSSIIGYDTAIGIEVTDGNNGVGLTGSTSAIRNNWTAKTDSSAIGVGSEKMLLYYGYSNNSQQHALSVGFTGNTGYLCTQNKTTGESLSTDSTSFDADIKYDVALSNVGNTSAGATGLAFGTYKLYQPALDKVTITNSMDNGIFNIYDNDDNEIDNTSGIDGVFNGYFNGSTTAMRDDYSWTVTQSVGGTGYSLLTDTMVTNYESTVTQNSTYMQTLDVNYTHRLTVNNAELHYNDAYITLDNTVETLELGNYQNNSYVYFKSKAQNSNGNQDGRSYVNSNTINGGVAPSVYVQYMNDSSSLQADGLVATGATGITGKAMTEYNVNYTVNVIAGSSNQYWTSSNALANNNLIVDASSSLILNTKAGATAGVTCKLGDVVKSYNNNDLFISEFTASGNGIAKFEADVNIFNVYTNIDDDSLEIYGADEVSINYTGSDGRAASFTGANSYCTTNLFTDISDNEMSATSTTRPGIKVSAKGYGSKSQYPLNFSLQIFAKCGESLMYDLSKNAVGCNAGDWKLGVGSDTSITVNTKTPLDTHGANIAVGILHSLTDGSFPGISSNISGFKIYPVATNKTVSMYVDVVNATGEVLLKQGPYKLNDVSATTEPKFGLTGNKVYSYEVSAGAFHLNLGAYENLYVQYPKMYAAYQAGNANTDTNTTYSSTNSTQTTPDNVSMTFNFKNNFNVLKTHFAQFVTTSSGLAFGAGQNINASFKDIDLWYDVSNKTTLTNGAESIDFMCEYTDTGLKLLGTTMAWVNLNTSTSQYDINNYSIYNDKAQNITNNYTLALHATTDEVLNVLQSLSVIDKADGDRALATIYFSSTATPSNNYHLYWCPKTIFNITATNPTSLEFVNQPVPRLGQTTHLHNGVGSDWLHVDTGVYLYYMPSVVYTGTMMFSLSNDMYSHDNRSSANPSHPTYIVAEIQHTLTSSAIPLDTDNDTGYMNFKLKQYRGACINSTNVVSISRTPARAKVLLNNISNELVNVYKGASYYVVTQSGKLQLSLSDTNNIGLKLTFSQSYSKDSNYGQNLLLNSSSTNTYNINLSYNTYTVTSVNDSETSLIPHVVPINGVIGIVGNDATFKASTPYKIYVKSIYGGAVGNSFKVTPNMSNYNYTISSSTANNNTKKNNTVAFENSELKYYTVLKNGYCVPNTFIKLTKQSNVIPTVNKSYYFQFVIPQLNFTTAIDNHTLDNVATDISMNSAVYNPFAGYSANNTEFTNAGQGTTVNWYWDYVRTSFGPATFALNSPTVKLYQNYGTEFNKLIYNGSMYDLNNLTTTSEYGEFKLNINSSGSIINASFLQDYSRYNLINESNRISLNIPKWVYYNGVAGQFKTCYANVMANNNQICAMGSVINRNDFGFPTSVEVLLYTTDRYSSTIYNTPSVNYKSQNLTTISFPFTAAYRTSYPISASLNINTINFNALIKAVSSNVLPYSSSSLPVSDSPFNWATDNSINPEKWVKSTSLPSLPMLHLTPVNKRGNDVLINFIGTTSTLNTINMCVARSTPIRLTVDNALNIISELDETGNFIGKNIDIHS